MDYKMMRDLENALNILKDALYTLKSDTLKLAEAAKALKETMDDIQK